MITPEQRETRRKAAGSSDAAAILGVDPYRTAWDVWASKTGRLEDGPETESMKAGTIFESAVLDWASRSLGGIIRNPAELVSEDLHLVSHRDAMVQVDESPVEAKTTGLFGPVQQEWGEDGSDEVPPHVVVQCMVHLLLGPIDVDRCWVPAFIGGRGFAMFVVPRNQELCNVISERVPAWWQKHVIGDTPPENCTPSLDLLKRIRRQPGTVATLTPERVARWMELRAQRLEIAKAEELEQAAILAELGTAEAGDAGPAGFLTYYQQSRKEHVVPASTFRVLRIKRHKE